VRNVTEAGVSWLRRLWRPSIEQPGSERGSEVLLPLEQTLGVLESLICEGVVQRPGVAASAARARRMEPAGPAARNAFGRPVQEELATGPSSGVTLATGMALSGLRSTAFLAGDQLPAAHGVLRSAAERLVPLVLHAANGDFGHAGYHGVADCGFFQLLPSSGQEALDLSLVARWLSERALVPGLVATDGLVIERMFLPDEGTLRDYLGEPDAAILSPTSAQRILFGTNRPRLVRWFDPNRPVGTGGVKGAAEEARARLGRRLFFSDHVAELATEGMQELSRLTGRPLSFVRRYRLEDAEAVVVAQGALVQSAEAAADWLRRSRRLKVGVLGLTWLRPLPTRELAEALNGRRAVAVVEALDEPMAAEPPLLRELRTVVTSTEGWISATCSGRGPDPARLSALLELLCKSERPRSIQLDRVPIPEVSGFPRRDALLQALSNDYPQLRTSPLPQADSIVAEPDRGRSVGLLGREAELPPDALRLGLGGTGSRGARRVPGSGASSGCIPSPGGDCKFPGFGPSTWLGQRGWHSPCEQQRSSGARLAGAARWMVPLGPGARSSCPDCQRTVQGRVRGPPSLSQR
jgi:pyruvate/2-oxoacid:ferredoxin oxidoreductase alpha subunit